MKNKIFLIVILSLLIIPSAMALTSSDVSYTIKQNTPYDLKRACFNNGTWCGGDAKCNITIVNMQDGLILIDNKVMTNQTSFHNYTLTATQDVNIGYYKADMVCLDGSAKGDETFYYQVTPSGELTGALGLYVILFVLGYGILLIGIFTKSIPVTIIGGFALGILGLYTLNNGIDVYRNFATEALSIITMAIGSFWMVKAAIEQLEIYNGI